MKPPNYDFFLDIFDDTQRHPYKLITYWFMDACYGYSKMQLKPRANYQNRWREDESEFNYAYREYRESFSRPIEHLMLEVITLLAFGGRAPEHIEKQHRNNIDAILQKNNLKALMSELFEDEAIEFSRDLSLLGYAPD